MGMLVKGAAVGAFAVLYLVTLSACAPKSRDGADDLWLGVRYNEQRR